MRVLKIFNLPRDQSEYEASNMGMASCCKLSDIDNFCRTQVRHAGLTEDAEKLAESIREMIREIPLERIE